MNTFRAINISTLVLLALCMSTRIAATEIYHWVDENGVPHYSQQAPGSDTRGVSKQALVDTDPTGNGEAEDVYNVEAHEKHMAEWRADREKQRKEARENKCYSAQQQPIKYQQSNRDYSQSLWLPPIYGRPPYRPPHRKPYRPPNKPPHNPPQNSDRPIFNPRPPTTSLSGDGGR